MKNLNTLAIHKLYLFNLRENFYVLKFSDSQNFDLKANVIFERRNVKCANKIIKCLYYNFDCNILLISDMFGKYNNIINTHTLCVYKLMLYVKI